MGECAVLPDGVPLSSPPAAPPALPAALTAPSCTHGTAALACSVVAGHGDRGHGHIGAPRGGTAGAAWPRRRLRSGRETPASPHPQPPIPPSPHPLSPPPPLPPDHSAATAEGGPRASDLASGLFCLRRHLTSAQAPPPAASSSLTHQAGTLEVSCHLPLTPSGSGPRVVSQASSLMLIASCESGALSECHLCLLAVPRGARVPHPRAAGLARMRARDQEPGA